MLESAGSGGVAGEFPVALAVKDFVRQRLLPGLIQRLPRW